MYHCCQGKLLICSGGGYKVKGEKKGIQWEAFWQKDYKRAPWFFLAMSLLFFHLLPSGNLCFSLSPFFFLSLFFGACLFSTVGEIALLWLLTVKRGKEKQPQEADDALRQTRHQKCLANFVPVWLQMHRTKVTKTCVSVCVCVWWLRVNVNWQHCQLCIRNTNVATKCLRLIKAERWCAMFAVVKVALWEL